VPRAVRQTAARGIALPIMVFALVVVGLLLGSGLAVLNGAQHSQTQQIQAARAAAAARSATEWGAWQMSDPQAALGLPGDTTPPCFASQSLSLPAPLTDFTVQVSCTRTPSSGQVDEGGLKLATYRIVAVATLGDASQEGHVRRQVEVRHTVCKNPGGTGPTYAC
jgi:type II secretory pathway pseudopilin PulG